MSHTRYPEGRQRLRTDEHMQLGPEGSQLASNSIPSAADSGPHRPELQAQRSSDIRPSKRKPNPSPLQSSESTGDNITRPASNSPRNQIFPRPPAHHSSSPRSAFYSSSTYTDQPRSPRERLDDLLATEGSSYIPQQHEGTPMSIAEKSMAQGVSTSLKAPSYGQLRNISAPVPSSQISDASPPTSPMTAPSAMKGTRPEPRPMPRTSSIDSAISSISSNTSHSHKSSQDSGVATVADIGSLISAAGSPEAVIQYLLKEKQSAAAQNAQLWRLVDKQRAMILGLNKDLERSLKDKDRYRKKLKEHLAQVPPVPSTAHQSALNEERANSQSPAPSDQLEDIPVRGSSVQDIVRRGLMSQGRIKDDTQDTQSSVDAALGPYPITPPLDKPESITPQPVGHGGLHTESSPPHSDRTEEGLDPNTPEQHVLSTQTREASNVEKGSILNKSTLTEQESGGAISPRSFTAKRAAPQLQRPLDAPSLAFTEASPLAETGERMLPPPRKPPPAPLNLSPTARTDSHLHQLGPEDHSGSEYDDILEVDEIPAFERGRRKTREEDDMEREAVSVKEKEHRSQSKKEKGQKIATDAPVPPITGQSQAPGNADPPQPPGTKHFKSLSPSPSNMGGLSSPASLASVLSQPSSEASTAERQFASPAPMSPGLPMSPRPTGRPMNLPLPRMPREGISLPLSPRHGFPGLPLSPRAPRHPIPLPPNTPMSVGSPGLPRSDSLRKKINPSHSVLGQGKTSPIKESRTPSGLADSLGSSDTSHIYRGLVSESYPDLLLPPNALPSIDIKVSSSRLRPSRYSLLASKTSEDDQIFTLGIFARHDGKELWRTEKVILSLPQLDHQVKQFTNVDVKLPDRSLFSGHAPAKIDARRDALEQYFEALLDTQLDEQAALAVCQFLSLDVIEPHDDGISSLRDTHIVETSRTVETARKPKKQGYLTKKGKNFGGWKVRFFSLEGPALRYYESPEGSHLGTIKLQGAQIGKQSQQQSSHSPSRGDGDSDNQYRHAFLVLEPKRKDSTSHVRHVLCAESDTERDEWVDALLQYVDYTSDDEQSRPKLRPDDSTSGKIAGYPTVQKVQGFEKKDLGGKDNPDLDDIDTLRGMSYETTVAAEAPVRGGTPSRHADETPSPPLTSIQPPSTPPVQTSPSHPSKLISGPTNGAVIHDAGAWGNKPKALALPQGKDKEHKKRSIWGFRGRSSSDLAIQIQTNGGSNTSLPQQHALERTGPLRAVFGAPLIEAVEYCRPVGVDVYLPAVVYRCIEYLDAKDAADEEGIFRLSGSSVVIKQLRERFNTQGDVDFLADDQHYDVHAVASLLKLYFRELPSTVLTRELHLDFLQVLELDDKEKKIAAYNGLVQKLPKANWSLLRALSAFLISIVNNSDLNKMTVRNVGIVFSPTLNIPAPVFSMFLTEFDGIFEDTYREDLSKTIEVPAVTAPLTPEDIRSPRRQLFSELPTPSYNQSTFPSHSRPNQQMANVSRTVYDTGFIPLQASYEQPAYGQSGSVTMPGPEYGSLNGTLAADNPQATKARRRESSMLLMGGGQRTSSMPKMNEDPGMSESRAF
ncbi:MAG: hypothetical protein M1827_000815 [Pycnora praestabilis]|nr:MAG: hypothetical protein M1827_000815 [Pycnora praestabilis]